MDSRSYAVQEYVDKKRSFHSIGKELGKNPKTIRDWILKAGIKPRSKSQAQKLVIERDGPPVTRPRTEEEKRKISDGLNRRIEEMTDEEEQEYRATLSARAKAQWAGVSKEEKEIIMAPMRDGAKMQAGLGSRAENKIAELLAEAGYNTVRRSNTFTSPYHIDILILKEKIAIECDGPTHFSPIYGEEEFLKTQQRDKVKDGFLTKLGLSVIRVQDNTTSYSFSSCKKSADAIVKLIETKKDWAPEVQHIKMK